MKTSIESSFKSVFMFKADKISFIANKFLIESPKRWKNKITNGAQQIKINHKIIFKKGKL